VPRSFETVQWLMIITAYDALKIWRSEKCENSSNYSLEIGLVVFCSRVSKWGKKAIHNSLTSCYAAHRACFIDANFYLLQNSTRIHSHEQITKTHLITIAYIRKFARYAISCYIADIYSRIRLARSAFWKNVPIILELLIQKIIDNRLAVRDMIITDARCSRSC